MIKKVRKGPEVFLSTGHVNNPHWLVGDKGEREFIIILIIMIIADDATKLKSSVIVSDAYTNVKSCPSPYTALRLLRDNESGGYPTLETIIENGRFYFNGILYKLRDIQIYMDQRVLLHGRSYVVEPGV